MKKPAMFLCLTLALALTANAADNNRQRLADASRARLTDVARALTIVTWSDRVDGFLAEAPSAQPLGSRWNAKEPHWAAARNSILGYLMKAFRDLENAPQARERMDKGFDGLLTDEEAAQVLALPAAERKQLDDFADSITLALDMMERDKRIKPGSPAFYDELAPAQKVLGIDSASARNAPTAKLAEKTSRDYRQARQSAVQFLRTALDGQLQLFFNDNLDAMQKIAEKAVKEAATSK